MGLNLCLIWRLIIPPIEIVAHPLSNLFILLALWFFMYAGLFHSLFVVPRVALPDALLTTLIFSFLALSQFPMELLMQV